MLKILNGAIHIEEQIGKGANSKVYKGWHERLNKYVAIKAVNADTRRSVEVQRNEVEALKNVKNAYIPQVYDFIRTDDSAFTVLEYIEGVSFDHLIKSGHRFSSNEIIKWYSQLASALKALHSQNICHRDIKPGNIMYTVSGDVCLIDFNAAFVNDYKVWSISCSHGYASPEQVEIFRKIKDGNRGEKGKYVHDDIDWMRSDIFSLGATMFHISTGRHPKDSFAPGNSEYRQSLSRWDKIVGSALRAYIRGDKVKTLLTSIISRSMAHDPKKRYAGGIELSGAFQRLPPPPPEKPPPPPRLPPPLKPPPDDLPPKPPKPPLDRPPPELPPKPPNPLPPELLGGVPEPLLPLPLLPVPPRPLPPLPPLGPRGLRQLLL